MWYATTLGPNPMEVVVIPVTQKFQDVYLNPFPSNFTST